MKHEPPPRPIRTFAVTAIRLMGAGGRFLKWLGFALLLTGPVLVLVHSDRITEVLTNWGLALLAWAAIFVGWNLTLAFLRWWMERWQHGDG